MGRSLKKLRRDLGAEDKHGALWELVTLYVASKIGEIDHEPAEATPDVRVRAGEMQAIWIEAKHVESPAVQHSENLQQFCGWLSWRLKKQKVSAADFRWRFEELPWEDQPSSPIARTSIWRRFLDELHLLKKSRGMPSPTDSADSRNVRPDVLPSRQKWKALVRTSEWKLFVGDLRENRNAVLRASTGGFSCQISAEYHPNPHGYLTSGYATLQIQEFDRHPVYRAIKDKAMQAKKWDIGDAPLVVCVGCTSECGYLKDCHYPTVSARDAAIVALHDLARAVHVPGASDTIRATNRELRVSGSSRISAVLLVSVEDRSLGVLQGYERTAESFLIVNHQCSHPLSASELRIVEHLPFDRIQFANDAEPYMGSREHNQSKRSSHGAKVLTMSSDEDRTTEVIIPEQDLFWILAGRANSKDVLKRYNSENALQIFSQEPPLIGIERVPGNPEKAEPDCVKFIVRAPRERLY